MSNSNLIRQTPLSRIKTDGGDVLHALKNDDITFEGFGEAYFSLIQFKYVKAWKCHHKMTMNLVVPKGSVKFVFKNPSKNSFEEYKIGEENYCRLTVPPNIWFGFQGLSRNTSLILNLSNIKHDPLEVSRKSIKDFNFNWKN